MLNSLKIFCKMSSNAVLNRIKNNANTTQHTIKNMKSEIATIKRHLIARTVRELEAENKRLRDEIENTKRRLIQLEISRGVKQIPVPNRKKHNACDLSEETGKPVAETVSAKPDQPPTSAETRVKKNKNEKKNEKIVEKTEKPKKEKPLTAPEPPVDVGRLDLRVGHIREVQKHPDADSLYVSKIDCGEPNLRTVVSGLVKFVPREELEGRMVVVMCNLKPAKVHLSKLFSMRGITSEAMVMCASTPEKVEVLSPPAGAQPGDLVHCDGYERNPDAQLNPKKKIWETCAPDLKTNKCLEACYKDAPLFVPGKGKIVAQTLAEVQVK